MDDNPKPTRSALRRWMFPLILCGVVTVASVAFWYARGHTAWAYGSDSRVAAGAEVTLREVVWTAAQPLEPPIPAAGEDQQYEPAFSPDGTELYFVRGKPGDGHAHIYASYLRDNRWTAPVALEGVNGPADDLSPRVTADSKFLLFSSNRAGGVGGFDIWAAPRLEGGKWGAPYNLGRAINSEFNESNPDPTPDGKRLIFSTDRKAAGKEQIQAWRATIRQTVSTDYDLWIASLDDGVSEAPPPFTGPTTRASRGILFKGAREIPGGINTAFVEGASCVSPAGDFVYFASNRSGGYGKFDLYRSRISGGGETFGLPENLGPAVNTASNETDPALIFNGFRLCFSSDRGNPRGIYALHRSDSREVFALRQGRSFPTLGWSPWLLLLSALLLIPLIMALRGSDMGRRLSILQKCLLLSLLVHVALTFVFSFVQVTQQIVHHMKRDANKEIAVNLNLPKDVEIGLSVRNQISSDLPTGDAPPASVEKAVFPKELESAPPPVVTTAAPAADRAAIITPSVDLSATMRPVSSLVVTPVTPTPKPSIPQSIPTLEALAPAVAVEKVADARSDATPVPQKPAIKMARSASVAPQATAPIPTVTASVPKASAGSFSEEAEVHPPQPTHLGAGAVDPAIAGGPAPSVPETATRLADLKPVTPAGASHVSEPAPVAAQFTAPGPTSSRLAPAPRGDATNPSARPVIIAGGGAPARPTTGPTLLADGALQPAPYQASDPVGVPAAAPFATALGPSAPIGRVDPVLQPIAAAVPRVGSDTPAMPSTDDARPAAAHRAAPAAVTSSPTPGDVYTDATALAPVTAPSPSAASISTGSAFVPRAAPITVPDAALQPHIALAPIPGPITAGPVRVIAAPFPRAPEVRKPRVEQLGGNNASEAAVDRGLAYLARNQEPDGRWTFIAPNDAGRPGHRPRGYHDVGCTGLAVLAFITRDNTPDKPGPYRNHVNKALDFLLAEQDDNGDLRGPRQARGEGSSRADMYDHAIATLALAEAGVMTGDKRYADAALLGARFIIAAQDPESGGWRYVPGEFGDTSVFGWQLMALHACERLGFEIPARTRELANGWIHLATRGPRRMIASYQPRREPTAAMTAEMLYARMLLGQKLDEEDIKEATDYLAQSRPDVRKPNVYYWYYGSLCMLQVQSDLWKRWNAQTRDALIALQSRNGGADGSWNADPKYGDRAGRVYMTSLALLTLEVYYRYDVMKPQGN
jgi:hypothetical protein